MINKEIILNADGSIKKDFSDRAIPQNSNNQVSVNVLIPSTCFTGLQNYAVILGISRIISNEETILNSLIMTASKTITIEGVLYVKYSAILSYSYTDKIATLKLSPYIQTTATATIDNEIVETISIQQAFTNSNLNVIKSVLPQYDASMEEATIATTLAGQIALKKIYTFKDTDSASIGQHYYELATGYDPTATQFEGCLVVSVYDNETRQYIPFLNNGDVELLEITKDGKFYLISGVDYSNSTYTYTRKQLSYSKDEVDTILQNYYTKSENYSKAEVNTLLNAKVDKTQKVNGHALSGDITLTKGDVGLGNVVNYGVETTPTASGDQLYITSKGVYNALQALNSAITLALSGKADTSDITALDSRLDAIETLIGDNDGDQDNIINTLKEVIATLSGLGENANILSMINSKVSQSDFDTLNNQINGAGGLKDKVDIIADQDNAYAEIKAQSGTIDILTTDWEANTGDIEYPYKWELSNGYLVGAVNVIVVFEKDSDTSLLSSTVAIDEENGKIIIYASDLPSDTIKIEKIAVFNDLNAFINYSNTIVQQVLQNTASINEINNAKLPQYIKKELSTTTHDFNTDNYAYRFGVSVINNTNNKCGAFYVNEDGVELVAYINYDDNDKHTLTLDANGLKLDGNAVGGRDKYEIKINLLSQNITNYALYVNIPKYIIDDTCDALSTTPSGLITSLATYIQNYISGQTTFAYSGIQQILEWGTSFVLRGTQSGTPITKSFLMWEDTSDGSHNKITFYNSMKNDTGEIVFFDTDAINSTTPLEIL